MAAVATKRVRNQQERETRILQTALTFAAQGGYDAVQMRSVADTANVSMATIYRYFNSKDEMLIAGLAGWVALKRRQVLSEPVHGDTAADRVAATLAGVATTTDQHPLLMDALIRAMGAPLPEASVHRRRIEGEISRIVIHAVGNEDVENLPAILKVIGHVWFSTLTLWTRGDREDGSVGAELSNVAQLLLKPTTCSCQPDTATEANAASKAAASNGSENK